MATDAVIARERKRWKLYRKYAQKRARLKKEGKWEELALLPRNSSPVRLRFRCQLTGRPRGNYRAFGLCRIKLRELALEGKIPGMTKASW
ncbi:MAG: 30S ribosomal protein S14 [Bacteroidia bacterium]|nr:30S ribosomal protein S14 [Bacteroidia bacterium]MCX7764869.1 30S ribosomal protein S14 [Bacteroidia bacterium]MDW8057186.1 30S ribosomal protein S14 [Bacteroidia bacterium]